MNLIFRILHSSLSMFLIFLPSLVIAQKEQPNVGFLRVVNVITSGQGYMNVIIDGEDILPKGYAAGQQTGGFAIEAGTHTVLVKKAGVTTGRAKFTLNKGETLSLVVFAEKVPPKKESDAPTWVAKILRLKQNDPENGYHLTLLSLCAEDEIQIQAQIEGRNLPETVHAKRLVVTGIHIGKSKKETALTVGDRSLAQVSMDEAGNYVVIFYEDDLGVVKAITFFDSRFDIAG